MKYTTGKRLNSGLHLIPDLCQHREDKSRAGENEPGGGAAALGKWPHALGGTGLWSFTAFARGIPFYRWGNGVLGKKSQGSMKLPPPTSRLPWWRKWLCLLAMKVSRLTKDISGVATSSRKDWIRLVLWSDFFLKMEIKFT